MRELRFRAWDKEKSRWVREYDYQLEDREDPAYEKEYGEDSYWLDGEVASDLDLVNDRLAIDRYVWEQYTGLKDKNGKEIYEGDIVKISDAPAVSGEALIVKFDEFLIDEYNCNKMTGWMVQVINGEWAASLADEVSRCEVIGNIHESSELLGGEEK